MPKHDPEFRMPLEIPLRTMHKTIVLAIALVLGTFTAYVILALILMQGI